MNLKTVGITLVSTLALCGIGVTASANSTQSQNLTNTPIVKIVNAKSSSQSSNTPTASNNSSQDTKTSKVPVNSPSNQNNQKDFTKIPQQQSQKDNQRNINGIKNNNKSVTNPQIKHQNISSNHNNGNNNYSKRAVNNLTTASKNLYNDKDIKFDKNGNIKYMNLNNFKKKFGNTPQLRKIRQITQSTNQKNNQQEKYIEPTQPELGITRKTKFARCIKRKILKSLGINEIKLLFNGRAKKFLKSHMYKTFAKYIVKRSSKVLGRKASRYVIKYLGKKLLPGWPELTIGANLLDCGARVI